MTAPTAAAMATAIDEAIYALVSGKIAEYRINGKTFTYQELDALRALRHEYSAMALSATTYGNRSYTRLG